MIACCTQEGDSETAYLRKIWHGHFGDLLGHLESNPYFHAYPAFDMFIPTRGQRPTPPPDKTGPM